ncbi:MAG: hypothetical protein A3D35_03615 [Candidatus Staskawiczbacteria bacterium RIFCSPHIGHO2_02_FULL_34_9]|uniref:Endonuclease GajA/Old nuclease/RecF-like AAA domain-containing protein n=1 Tax=Candidatus Staskawiczbacteria bacterium RIFCSPHIGHO2_02_FULL_34_9 TaxID=1802206 RepID=A0A1G2HXH6_9BACT|nr:MAG: hypothetical protein A3D35_03615 [Candidatus Staskawiczbacteria bacterium RIFCSPHIGHO2_02_FULL_34_9]
MEKISKIIFNEENKTIKKGFILDGLKEFTVITGENNTGKTNFIKGVAEEKVQFIDKNNKPIDKSKIRIVHIRAENVEPTEGETKFSAENTSLFDNLSDLFNNLGINFNLDKEQETKDNIDKLFSKLNDNLNSINIEGGYKVNHSFTKKLKEKIIFKLLINKIDVSEGDESREIKDLGHGMQRLIVLSILKAYTDLLLEKQLLDDCLVLILFEEPEVYLHPKFKRYLNRVLRELAFEDNHQVLITTHDPYFTITDFKSPEKVTFSFTKENKQTRASKQDRIIGIEDEVLHMLLYSECMRREIKFKTDFPRLYINDERTQKRYKKPPTEKKNFQQHIRDQIHHPENEKTFKLVILKGDLMPTDMNYYTEEELKESIREMNELLSRSE